MYGRTHRVLSVQQPWAWLIVEGYKPVENRTWVTHLRGWIGIHAAKTFDHEGYLWVKKAFPEISLPDYARFDRGGIVGRARLVDCVRSHGSRWFFGPYGFVFEDPEPMPLIPCRGLQGFFKPEIGASDFTQPGGRRRCRRQGCGRELSDAAALFGNGDCDHCALAAKSGRQEAYQ